MNIKEKLNHMTPTLWGIVGLIVVSVIVLCVEFLSYHEHRTWYLLSLKKAACLNAQEQARAIGFPQMATPAKFDAWERHHSSQVVGMRTEELPFHLGKDIQFLNYNGGLITVYFSQKKGCELILKGAKEDN